MIRLTIKKPLPASAMPGQVVAQPLKADQRAEPSRRHYSAVELLSVADIARILAVSSGTVRRYIRDGSLPAKKIGGSVRVHPDDLDAFVDGTGT